MVIFFCTITLAHEQQSNMNIDVQSCSHRSCRITIYAIFCLVTVQNVLTKHHIKSHYISNDANLLFVQKQCLIPENYSYMYPHAREFFVKLPAPLEIPM